MKKYICFLNKENKKISYPNLTVIEPLFRQKLQPLNLITNELNAGDILVIEYEFDKIKRIYKSLDLINLEQIYGEPKQDNDLVILRLFCVTKQNAITNYITDLIKDLTIQELISNKHDLDMFEKEFNKYLLHCKNSDKYSLKNCRSVIFKTCKDVKLAEKMYIFIKNKPFKFFLHESTELIVNFDEWTVQVNYDC